MPLLVTEYQMVSVFLKGLGDEEWRGERLAAGQLSSRGKIKKPSGVTVFYLVPLERQTARLRHAQNRSDNHLKLKDFLQSRKSKNPCNRSRGCLHL